MSGVANVNGTRSRNESVTIHVIGFGRPCKIGMRHTISVDGGQVVYGIYKWHNHTGTTGIGIGSLLPLFLLLSLLVLAFLPLLLLLLPNHGLKRNRLRHVVVVVRCEDRLALSVLRVLPRVRRLRGVYQSPLLPIRMSPQALTPIIMIS